MKRIWPVSPDEVEETETMVPVLNVTAAVSHSDGNIYIFTADGLMYRVTIAPFEIHLMFEPQ